MRQSPFRLASAALASALVATALAGCYVIPIDAHPPSQPPIPPVPTVLPAPIATAPALVQVRLYPLNTQANRAGLITAQVFDNNAGRGTFLVSYLGDAMQGESTRVDATNPAFGRLHAEVLGASPRSFAGRRGIANAYGARGINAQCEYVLTGAASGTGVCRFSDGATFQMHFGA